MKRTSKYIFMGMASIIALSACTAQDPGFESATTDKLTQQVDTLAAKSETIRRGGTVDADRAFYGRNMSSSFDQYAPDNGVPFPAKFEQADALEIVTPEPASVKQVELLMQELTGLNVVVRTRYKSGEHDLDIPINKKIRVNHKGPLSELVRTVASRFDLSWSFDGETITFDRMDTRSYDLPLPAASGNITASLSGVKVAGNSVSSTKNVTLDPWQEVTAALESVIESPGKVTVSPNTGQVTIFAPASAQEEAAKIINTFDQLYSRRIGLEIATFYVDTRKSAELSTDLGVSISSGDVSASLGQGLASAMQGGIGVISGTNGSASFNLQNIAGSQAVADYQMSNTIAQNGVVAPVVLTNSRKYVSEIKSGTSDSNTTTGPTISTDYIDSGISIYSLPRLMRNGKIHLSVWVTQAELNNLQTFDTGSGFVQLPDSDQRAVEYTLIMEPGETLVMGGYEQERSSTKRDGGLGGLGALGIRNNREGGTERSRMVLMVRPTLIGN